MVILAFCIACLLGIGELSDLRFPFQAFKPNAADLKEIL